ncbi:DUF4179 domain-containing protein [Eubacterium album]|jgi:hypothetical protein|uniref:DUF4179 domain-containing protein n=1 Tax=Eubacterium album TaxID=2978477 RepID=A0ABT2M3B5_9FIRM|nr:DUF4179 domain-containing protein [Eubacterium sp. LFL-14]MCT7400011.1 DUF4179 domain-containing protein [Eubacterium sp. LFL-14]
MDVNEYKKVYDEIKTSEKIDNKILNSVKDTKKKHSYPRLLKVASIALACILLSNGSVYAINYILHMDSHVKNKVIKTTEKETHEQYLIKNGYDTIYTDSNLKNIKCEDKGISVELVETVADNNIAYVYFKVDYGKWEKTVEDMGYDLVDVFMDVDFYCTKSNGKQVGLSWATGYANHYKSDDTSYTYGFDVDNERDLDFENITMEIKSFYATGHTVYSEDETFVNGNWKISWDLKHGTEELRKTFNREIDLGEKYNNKKVYINEIIITPIEYTIYYSYHKGEKNTLPLIDVIDELNTGIATLNIKGKETSPKVISQIDSVENGSKRSKYTVFTGVIGNLDDIKSITLPGNNTFDMTN